MVAHYLNEKRVDVETPLEGPWQGLDVILPDDVEVLSH